MVGLVGLCVRGLRVVVVVAGRAVCAGAEGGSGGAGGAVCAGAEGGSGGAGRAVCAGAEGGSGGGW